MISYNEALRLILNQPFNTGMSEPVSLPEAFGRILEDNQLADRDYPPFHRSQMDGYAVSLKYYIPGKFYRIESVVYAGNAPEKIKDTEGGCVKIMTGAAVPENCDVVIRKEDSAIEDNQVKFQAESIMQWQNISLRGEDILAGQVVVPGGQFVSESTVIPLTSIGAIKVKVKPRLRIAILTTGNEVVNIAEKPNEYQIRNANSLSLQYLISKYPAEIISCEHVSDSKNTLATSIGHALASDILIISGAVSMGDSDFVPEVLRELGVECLFHKSAVKPGKPIWYGRKSNCFVFGLPGNPISCTISFHMFVVPLMRKITGMPLRSPILLPLAQNRVKRHDLTEFFPCKLENMERRMTRIIPQKIHSSGDITGLMGSCGLGIHTAQKKELQENEIVEFYPFASI